jgi:hypothetical protein
VYDMYPWDRGADPDENTETAPALAAWALQVALDRRDNGAPGAPALGGRADR